MYDLSNTSSLNLEVVSPENLYRWNRNWFKMQQSFFEEDFVLMREKQIIDFAVLNGHSKVKIIKDTDIFKQELPFEVVNEGHTLTIVTDQRISRLPCHALIDYIKDITQRTDAYICLNRHYINIDNTFCDPTLNENYEIALGEWLRKYLDNTVIDLSLQWPDRGDYFTWSVPDRHFFIPRVK